MSTDDVTRLIVREDDGQIQVLLHLPGQPIAEGHGSPRPFASPLSDEDLEDLQWYLEDYLRAPYGVWAERGEAIAQQLLTWGAAIAISYRFSFISTTIHVLVGAVDPS